MKTASFARHITTYLGGLGALLLGLGWIHADQVQGVQESANALTEPLIIAIGLVGALITRILIAVVTNLFRLGSGEKPSGRAGGLNPLWVMGLGMTVGFMGCLPSCSPAQLDAVRGIPIRVTLITPEGDVGYSSKSGLSVDYRSGK